MTHPPFCFWLCYNDSKSKILIIEKIHVTLLSSSYMASKATLELSLPRPSRIFPFITMPIVTFIFMFPITLVFPFDFGLYTSVGKT